MSWKVARQRFPILERCLLRIVSKLRKVQSSLSKSKINRNSVKIVLMFAIDLELVGIIVIFAENIV